MTNKTSSVLGELPVIDFDAHVWEPEAVWTEYMDPGMRQDAKMALWREPLTEGADVVLNGKLVLEKLGWLSRAAVWRPGLTWAQIGEMAPEELTVNPAASDPAARLRDMDAIGVDQAVLFPSILGEYLPAVENPLIAEAFARSYNRWLAAFSSQDKSRLVPAAYIPMQTIGGARREVAWAAKEGFRVVVIRPTFQSGRYVNHPYYDSLWKDIEAAGLLLAVHPYPGSSNPARMSHGQFIEKVAARPTLNPMGHAIAEIVAPMQDGSMFMIAQCWYGFLQRFPELRFAVVGTRGGWFNLMLEKIEGFLGSQMGRLTTFPVRIDVDDIIEERQTVVVGIDADESMVHADQKFFGETAVWGSRFPTHQAMTAFEAIDRFRAGGVTEANIAAMMSGNAQRMLLGAEREIEMA